MAAAEQHNKFSQDHWSYIPPPAVHQDFERGMQDLISAAVGADKPNASLASNQNFQSELESAATDADGMYDRQQHVDTLVQALRSWDLAFKNHWNAMHWSSLNPTFLKLELEDGARVQELKLLKRMEDPIPSEQTEAEYEIRRMGDSMKAEMLQTVPAFALGDRYMDFFFALGSILGSDQENGGSLYSAFLTVNKQYPFEQTPTLLDKTKMMCFKQQDLELRAYAGEMELVHALSRTDDKHMFTSEVLRTPSFGQAFENGLGYFLGQLPVDLQGTADDGGSDTAIATKTANMIPTEGPTCRDVAIALLSIIRTFHL